MGRRIHPGMTPRRAILALKDDRGSAAAALGFSIIAAGLITIMASLAVAVSMTTGTAAAVSSMNSAIDGRYDAYRAELRTNPTPSTGETCTVATKTCASITSVVTNGSVVTVTLVASYANGAQTNTQDRVFGARDGALISGYDSDNNPVWTP